MEYLLDFLSRVQISDVIDILLVTYIIYYFIHLLTGTKAAQIAKGIVIILAITLISDTIHLNTINYILRNTIQVGLIAVIILFQPELRRTLENVGRNAFGNILKGGDESQDTNDVINKVCEAAGALASKRTGAIMVFQRKTNLDEMLIGQFTPVDSVVTVEMIQNIFYPNTPLHDGAVIIKDNRIYAANCYLPLTGIESLDQELGTRHRAGIGITEVSDCVSVMVSEETGKISIAVDGVIKRGISTDTLSKRLRSLLFEEEQQPEVKKWLKGKVAGK